MEEYGNLKLELAKNFPNDIDTYCSGKTEFITTILISYGMNKNDVKLIRDENKI